MVAALTSVLFESTPSIEPMRYTWLWNKICDKKVAVSDFGACDFVIRVGIDVCIVSLLIGYLNSLKLIAQSVINDLKHGNQA